MKTTKIIIKNLFGIKEMHLDGRSIEASGTNGVGKTSIIDALKAATIPVSGLEVKDGIPLINGLPISNLSEGEKLDLCVDVAIHKPSSLQIILLDGVERLSDANRDRLYRKCKEKGLQFIATRTTNSNEIEVVTL